MFELEIQTPGAGDDHVATSSVIMRQQIESVDDVSQEALPGLKAETLRFDSQACKVGSRLCT